MTTAATPRLDVACPIGEQLARSARLRPGSVALVDGSRRVTYEELLGRADRLAAELARRGVGPGDLVAVAIRRSADLVIALAGVVRSGAAYLPIDLDHPPERRAAVLADARPRLVVADGTRTDGIPGGLEVIPLPADRTSGWEPPVPAAPEDLAYVIYTSGSTGRPNGVRITQANASWLFASAAGTFGFGPDDVWTHFHSIAFDYSVWEMWGALLHGGRLVVVPPAIVRSPDAFHTLVRSEGVTVLCQTPSAFRAFDAADAAAARPASRLRRVFLGGESLDPRTLGAWFDAHGDEAPIVENLYGVTEATVVSTHRRVRTADARGAGTNLIGVPLPGLTIDVCDPDGRPLADGVVGEMRIRGPGVGAGYVDRAELTARRFGVEDGVARAYRTGDLVRRTDGGDLEYLGRADLQLKVGGFRIEPGEIEAVLRGAAGVRDAVVAVRGSGVASTRLVAYVVPADGAAVAPQALRDHVAVRLPAHMVPGAYVRIERVPRTSSDKLDRDALPEPAETDLPRATSGDAPRDGTEERLAAIWREVLGVSDVRRDDDFVSLGGDSLLAARIAIAAAAALRAGVSAFDVLEARTLADLAARVDASRADVSVPDDGAPPLRAVLTPGQRSLALQQAIAGASPVLNESAALELRGALGTDELVRCLGSTLAAHPALRLRFDLAGPEAVQELGTDAPPHVEVVDAPLADDVAIDALLARTAARGFDLAAGPPVRALVVRRSAEFHVVLVVAHHLVVDEWSVSLFLGELASRLRGENPAGDGDAGPLAFVRRRADASRRGAADDVAFWRAELAGAELDLGVPRPGEPSGDANAGAVAESALTGAQTRTLRERLRAAGVTEFEAGLAALASVLEHLAHRPDVVILTTFADRSRPDTANVVGYLLDVLPVRMRLDGDIAASELFARTRTNIARVSEHRALAVGEALAAAGLSLSRPGGGAGPVFFTRREDLAPGFDVPGVRASEREVRVGIAKFDCSVCLVSGHDQLRVVVEHRTGAVDAAAAGRLASLVARTLTSIATEPARPLAALDFLTADERAAVLAASCGPAGPPPPWTFVPERVAEFARAQPSAPAICEDARTVSYGELLAAADRVATRLRELGAGPDTVVPVIGRRSAAIVAAWLGVLRAGAAYAPIDADQPSLRRAAMIEACGASVVIADAEFRAGLPAGVSALELPEFGAGAELPPPGADRAGLAYVVFTSGSTGSPKGVEIGHDALAHVVDWYRRRFRLTHEDRLPLLAGVGFDATVLDTWAALCSGASLHLPDESVRLTPDLLRDWIVERAVTVAFAPTVLAESLLQLEWPAASRLRSLNAGGEALRRRPAAGLAFEVVNLYGPAEAAVWTTHAVVAPHGPGLPPIGVPLDDTGAWVMDHRGRPCGHGTTGELWLSGPQLARGYRGLPGRTAEAFPERDVAPGGRLRVYRTGDLVRRRADGALDFAGRRDTQVKLRGVRIEIGEIEAQLLRHPQVASCAVVLRGDPPNTQLVAYVESAGRGAASEDDLGAWLAERLPRSMVPAVWIRVDALPRSPNGKIDRAALPGVEGRWTVADAVPLRDDVDRGVAAIFAEVLGSAAASRDAHIFRTGGHSLHVVRVAALCKQRFGRAPSLSFLFGHPTVGEIADWVRRAEADEPIVASVARGGPVPLSPQQRALWLDVRIRGDAASYNVPLAFRVGVRLDAARLRAALERLAWAHEVLRARIDDAGGEPSMRFDLAPDALEFESATALDPAARDAAIRRTVERSFDLARGPLWRTLVCADPDGGSTLLLVFHHIVFDARSGDVLLRELAAGYDDPASAPESRRIDFGDIAVHEVARTAAERTALERHWSQALAGAELTPSLPPPCEPCPPGDEELGFTRRRDLGAPLVRRVRELASSWGTTPFAVYFAAYLAVLRVYCGADDLVVGTPVSLRDTPEAQAVAGYLLSPVAVRVRMREAASFRDNVDEVDRCVRDARAHARLPMDLVLGALDERHRDGLGSPFQAFFSLVDETSDELRLGGGRLSRIDLPSSRVTFRAFLLVESRRDDASLVLEFRRGAFDVAMAERLLRHVETLLRNAAAQPDAPLATIGVLDADEQAAALAASRGPAGPAGPPPIVPDRVAEMARERADAPALVEDGRTVSYAELLGAADAFASRLRALGVERDDVVPVIGPRCAAVVIAWLGVLRAGAAYAPIEPDQPSPRRAAMVGECRPKVIVAHAAFRDGLPDGATILDLPEASGGAPHAATPSVPASALAYVIFTSGSSGRPKGVEIEHGALAHLSDWLRRRLRLRAGDRVPLLSALGFDATVGDLWPALCAGATVFLPPDDVRMSPPRLRDWIVDRGVSAAFATTVLAEALVALDWPRETQLRTLYTGGETLRRRARAGVPFEFVNLYGPTESVVFATHATVATDGVGLPPIGTPLDDLTAYVVDRDGRICPDGVPGALLLAGPQLARGYRGLPDRTSEAFPTLVVEPGRRERVYRTGDVARRLPGGSLEFLGRRDGQIKVRGTRIEVGEIEAALLAHDGVGSCAVALRGDPETPYVAAYVEPKDQGRPPDAAALSEFLTERLPRAMIPGRWALLRALPRTQTGKIDRAALASVGTAAADDDGEPPRDDLERAVADVFAVVAGRVVAARTANLLRMGGHSIHVVRVAMLCRERFGCAIDLSSIFETPTVAGVASLLRRAQQGAASVAPMARVARGAPVPLAPSQRALWLDIQLRPDASAYNVALAFRAAGGLDADRLRAALVRLSEAHEVLRSRIRVEGSEPSMVFDVAHDRIEFEVRTEDAGVCRDDALGRAASKPFDLAAGPLWRTLLFAEAGGGATLLLVVHHIICDARSLSVLLRDLAATYSNPDAPVSREPHDFADFAAHELARTAAERDELTRFWASTLSGAELTPPLPTPSVPCLPGDEEAGGALRRGIDALLAQRVADAAASWGTTPFHVYFAAYLAVLRIYTATDDLVVRSPVSLRDTHESDAVVGYLLSPVAVRVRLDASASFRGTVLTVDRCFRDARAHARLPLDLVLRAARDRQRTGLGSPIQIIFSLVDDPFESVRLGGTAVTAVDVPDPRANSKLFLRVEQRRDGARFVLEFQRGVFDPAMAARFLGHVEVLLRGALARPDEPLGSIGALGADERAAAIAASCGPAGPPPPWTLVPNRIADVARATPGAPALVEAGRTVDYGTMLGAADALAARLRELGVAEDDVVPVLAPRGAAVVVAWLGVMRAGAAYAPIDPEQPVHRRAVLLRECRSRVVVAHADLRDGVPSGMTIVDLPDIGRSPPPAIAAPAGAAARALAYVIFTSGSTGQPKGVEIEHAAFAHLVDWQRRQFRLGPADRTTLVSGLGFDAAVGETWPTLCAGGAIHIPTDDARHAPARLRDWIVEERVTVAKAPTILAEALLSLAWPADAHLRLLHCGGEALRRRPRAGLPFEFVNIYGPTEFTDIATHAVVTPDGVGLPSIGRPLDDVRAFVVDRDGHVCPDGIAGELWLAGPQVARGYRDRPERTAAAFPTAEFEPGRRERMYRTGDIVRRRADGTLDFAGRVDGQVKLRGVRIEIGEIEAALLAHPGVGSCAVALRGAGEAPHLAAYVEAGDALRPPEAAALSDFLAERLPRAMVPTRWSVLGSLPRTSSGKIDRRALPELGPDDIARGRSEAADVATPAEQRVLGVWRELLAIPTLGPNDDFFAAGGHSLLAIEMLARVEREFGVRPAARVLVESSTARQFALVLSNATPVASDLPPGVVLLRGGDAGAPLFCLPGMGSVAFQFRVLAASMRTKRPILAIQVHELDVAPQVLESMGETADAVVRSMRRVQPAGPYSIVGYSYGGLLAFEIARQLRAAGESIELLAILDAYVPGTLRIPNRLRKVQTHLRILTQLTMEEIREYVGSRVRRRLRRAPAESAVPVPPEPDSHIERRIRETTERCSRAFEAYQAGSFDGRVNLVQATDVGDWVEVDDPSGTCGWGAICAGGVDVIRMGCRHLDLFREPHVAELAGRMDELLERAERRPR